MKIGIITFNSAHNYGAVLQVWALQKKLKNDGHEVHVINYRLPSIDSIYKVYEVVDKHKYKWLNDLKTKRLRLKTDRENPGKVRRYNEFERFINEVLPTTEAYNSYYTMRNADFDYDVMIAGSDQIWNGKLTKGINPAYFLNFGRPETVRVSYAASMGKTCFDDQEKRMVKTMLKNFDYISVREKNLLDAVGELSDMPAQLVLDPTLLLDKEDYDEIKDDKRFDGEYIFVHNVHLKIVDERLIKIAEKLSEKTGLPIINNRSDYDFSNEIGKLSDGSPEEFVGVISKAKYVVTNSFHATVFAMIYEKNFITVPHKTNPDRMIYLLSSFGLENHLISNVKQMPDDLRDLTIDYNKVAEIKKQIRVESEEFLKKAVEGPKIVGNIGKVKKRSLKKAHWNGYARLIDEATLKTVSGGGVAKAIADSIWASGGVVFGIGYDTGVTTKYMMAANEDEAKNFFKVKYLKANATEIFPQIKAELDKDKKVMFMGISEDIDELILYLGKKPKNLYTVEEFRPTLVEDEVYKKYFNAIEEKYSTKIIGVDFDNKAIDAQNVFTCIYFENGDIYAVKRSKNHLIKLTEKEMLLRSDLYDGIYNNHKTTAAEFSLISRFSGSKVDVLGEDYLFVNNDKASELFESIKDKLVLRESSEDQVKKNRLYKPHYDLIVDDAIKSADIEGTFRKYIRKYRKN